MQRVAEIRGRLLEVMGCIEAGVDSAFYSASKTDSHSRESDLTVVDQWSLTLVPKAPIAQDHKLRTIGSHPQKVVDVAAQVCFGPPLKQ